jgi:hypothetical protein
LDFKSIFLKSLKILYITIISNWAQIWASQVWNMGFQPVFAMNIIFRKPKNYNPFWFWEEIKYFLKHSSPWGSFYVLIRRYGTLHTFLDVLKIANFASKCKGVKLRFYQEKNASIFLVHEAYFLTHLGVTVIYINS